MRGSFLLGKLSEKMRNTVLNEWDQVGGRCAWSGTYMLWTEPLLFFILVSVVPMMPFK